ncbi:Aste57867_1031 [Aphanomyces stellatus]|uniref:Aste57867_1031 protein n=1 Tax=Aphanomyces stellatus TaxID=120398 RepID=A0A485K6T7_9STRA|nr:hypothetical protein As57867_001030 [Aphanomyces stellatus]VFT78253.1 Aste57867_1031 [Aphanomyces stellatus]
MNCADCDFRLVKVPPTANYNTSRPVLLASRQYPRYVDPNRAPAYAARSSDCASLDPRATSPSCTHESNHTLFPPSHVLLADLTLPSKLTFGYLDAQHGLLNDHQVAMGSSACAAKLAMIPESSGAAFDIAELTHVALERTATARDAILLMGHLAETYGYYGSDWDLIDDDDDGSGDDALRQAGDALVVADAVEGWVFHVLPDDTGTSAVWVAQRVPDNHVVAIANRFVIGHVNLTATENFMGSTNMYDVARRNGFWDGHAPFDFAVAFAPPTDGDDVHGHRVRRVYALISNVEGSSLNASNNVSKVSNASNNFNNVSSAGNNDNTTQLDLTNMVATFDSRPPFSIPATHLVDAFELMQIQRDHFEHSAWDLTLGAAAGPFGSPRRYEVDQSTDVGHFAHALSSPDASYSLVAVLHPISAIHALLWFAPYAADASVYTPVFVHTTSVATSLSTGSLRAFNASVAYWNHARVGNLASSFLYSLTQPLVAAMQLQVEAQALSDLRLVHRTALALLETVDNATAAAFLTSAGHLFAREAEIAWHDLFGQLMTTVHDGHIYHFDGGTSNTAFNVEPIVYPTWWGAWVTASWDMYNASTKDDDDDDGDDDNGDGDDFVHTASCAHVASSDVGGAIALIALMCLVLGYLMGRRSNRPRSYRYITELSP